MFALRQFVALLCTVACISRFPKVVCAFLWCHSFTHGDVMAGYLNKCFCVKVRCMSQGLSAKFDTSSTSGLRHYHNRWLSVDFAMKLWTSLRSFSPIDVTSSINQTLFTNMPSPGSVCPAAAHCKTWPSFCVNCKCIWGAQGREVGKRLVRSCAGKDEGGVMFTPIYCLSARKEKCRRPQMSAGLTVPRCCDLSDWTERIVG